MKLFSHLLRCRFVASIPFLAAVASAGLLADKVRLDPNGRLSSNTVLFSMSHEESDGDCLIPHVRSLHLVGLDFVPIDPENFPSGNNNNNNNKTETNHQLLNCPVACVSQGTAVEAIETEIQQHSMLHANIHNKSQFWNWFDPTCRQARLCVVHEYQSETTTADGQFATLKLYWRDPIAEAGLQFLKELAYQESYCVPTLSGHAFYLHLGGSVDTDAPIDSFAVDHSRVHRVVRNPNMPQSQQSLASQQQQQQQPTEEDPSCSDTKEASNNHNFPGNRDLVWSIQHDLNFDANGKLVTHTLYYPGDDDKNRNCPAAKVLVPAHFEFQPLAKQALEQVFPHYVRDKKTSKNNHHDKLVGCPVACAEQGTDLKVAHAVMPHRRHDNLTTEEDFWVWFHQACYRVEICLVNYHSEEHPLQIYWLKPNGRKQFQVAISYGESKSVCFTSVLGHRFQVTDGASGTVLDTLTAMHDTSKAIGTAPLSPRNEARHLQNLESEIRDSFHFQWNKHLQIKRSFSELGFQRGRLPDDVYASMGAFYYNNRHHVTREEWKQVGIIINWWQSDTYVVPAPWELKKHWQARLKEMVQTWAGVEVEQTMLYGLRQYTEGSRLLAHIDKEATHAVSLIVNIAQGNLSQPWPVEINDHAERLHEVIMEPGDVLFYESAKCLHARSRPLTGNNAYFVNLFTHYRPLGDPEWYNKPNPEHTPEPIMEINGSCRLQPTGVQQLANQKLGVVQEVVCDDKRLEETISPSLFRLTSGQDLHNWWELTSPQPQTSE